jgi:oligopeptide/dipeptide ABC transporter ATP-binding protein
MPPLLEIRNLCTWFPVHRGIVSRTVGNVRAVDGVSLQIGEGETVGLVGESGCGKTTLARTVLLLEHVHSGEIYFEGCNLRTAPAAEVLALRRRMQAVFQDPFASLNPRLTVIDIVTEGMVQHGLIRARDRKEAALKLLREVGLSEDALHRYPHEFSGGQRQRISVARALSVRPRLVICDEAVSALDVSVQAQVINLLLDLKREHNLAYLFISHDLSVVRHVADRVAVMYLGRIVEEGEATAVIDQPCHPYTRALVSAIPRPRQARRDRTVLAGDVPSPSRPPSGCRFHPRCPFAIERCRREEPVLEAPRLAADSGRRAACHRKDESPGTP